MTTMPHRIQDCKPVVESILSTGIAWLEFNIPKKSLRTCEEYIIPSWLTEMENVRIFRTPDYGPLTKILPTMQRHEDEPGWIITFDDDTLYKPTLVNAYTPFLSQTNVIGSLGFTMTMHGGLYPVTTGRCSIIFGYGSIVYPMNIYKTSDIEYFREVLKDKLCFQSDDLILSNFVYRKGYTCQIVTKLLNTIQGQLTSGMSDPLGLCNIEGRTIDKIFAAFKYLEDNNLASIIFQHPPAKYDHRRNLIFRFQ